MSKKPEPKGDAEYPMVEMTPTRLVALVLLGAAPIVFTTVVQSCASMHQLRVEQRITAFKEFSDACNDHIRYYNVQTRYVRWLATTKGQPGKEEFEKSIIEDIETERKRGPVRRARLGAATEMANAIFKTSVAPMGSIRFVEVNVEDVVANEAKYATPEARRARFQEYERNLIKLAEECQSSVAQLASKLDDF